MARKPPMASLTAASAVSQYAQGSSILVPKVSTQFADRTHFLPHRSARLVASRARLTASQDHIEGKSQDDSVNGMSLATRLGTQESVEASSQPQASPNNGIHPVLPNGATLNVSHAVSTDGPDSLNSSRPVTKYDHISSQRGSPDYDVTVAERAVQLSCRLTQRVQDQLRQQADVARSKADKSFVTIAGEFTPLLPNGTCYISSICRTPRTPGKRVQ